jgi:hypothetical protein
MKRQTISSENSGVVHGIWIVDWDGDKREHSDRQLHRHPCFLPRAPAENDPHESPGRSGRVAEIGLERRAEPARPASDSWRRSSVAWRKVAIYRGIGAWSRVDRRSLVDGRTIVTADLNGDGRDEVIAGYRGKAAAYTCTGHRTPPATNGPNRFLDDGGISAAAHRKPT